MKSPQLDVPSMAYYYASLLSMAIANALVTDTSSPYQLYDLESLLAAQSYG